MPFRATSVIPKNLLAALKKPTGPIQASAVLLDLTAGDADGVFQKLNTTASGLSDEEAEKRLEEYGPNVVTHERRFERLRLLGKALVNPLVILLLLLATVSLLTGDVRAATVMGLMVILGVVLRFVQEARADTAAAKLKAMITVTATVVRGGQAREIPLGQLVPGDVVKLAAGDMIPADVRLVATKDLFVIQSAMTGESFPVEKFDAKETQAARAPLEMRNVGFLGTSVESGSATAVVAATG
jgi:P-type Mg2+ transporter